MSFPTPRPKKNMSFIMSVLEKNKLHGTCRTCFIAIRYAARFVRGCRDAKQDVRCVPQLSVCVISFFVLRTFQFFLSHGTCPLNPGSQQNLRKGEHNATS
jgi:hypothetical protein